MSLAIHVFAVPTYLLVSRVIPVRLVMVVIMHLGVDWLYLIIPSNDNAALTLTSVVRVLPTVRQIPTVSTPKAHMSANVRKVLCGTQHMVVLPLLACVLMVQFAMKMLCVDRVKDTRIGANVKLVLLEMDCIVDQIRVSTLGE